MLVLAHQVTAKQAVLNEHPKTVQFPLKIINATDGKSHF
jgi:hypothetical protein